jgi:sigma-B regulation protein RsbU (phosphoserine phosphatase)
VPVFLTPEEQRRQMELEQELQLARDIQQGLLLAAVPHLPGWQLSAVSNPARDLGGDLYDFVPFPDGTQAIMIGDVSGKGLQAALRMAVARTVFRHELRHTTSPGATLAAVNRGVCADIPQGMITMLYAILDPLQGTLRMANAGHTYAVLFNDTVREYELPGMPLGVDPDCEYEEETIVIEPGDNLLLYTDGVVEAIDTDEQEYGFERLQYLLQANAHLKPRPLMKLLLRELRTWSGNLQTDDITMVIARRRLTQLGAELRSVLTDVLEAERAAAFWEEHIERTYGNTLLDATPDQWTEVLPEITKIAKAQFNRGLARELTQQLRLAIEEYRTDHHTDDARSHAELSRTWYSNDSTGTQNSSVKLHQ